MASRSRMLLLTLAVYITQICIAESVQVYFKENVSFILDCKIVGDGRNDVKYTWRKNRIVLDLHLNDDLKLKKKGALEFLRPTDFNVGIYQCFADTDFGTATSPYFEVEKGYLNYEKKTFTHKPVAGKPFHLDCPYPRGNPLKVKFSWVTQGNDNDVRNPIKNERIIQGGDGLLYFTNVTKEDAAVGKYLCLGESPAVDSPVVLAEHIFEDVVPGSDGIGELVAQYLSEDEVTYAGRKTLLYCIYGGRPLPYLDWYFGATKVNNHATDRINRYTRTRGQVLRIKDTKYSDEGTYTCVIEDKVGKPVRHSIKLTVLSPPIYIKKMESGVIVTEGQDVIIPCQVSGRKVPDLTWTYNAKPLNETDRISVNRTTQGNDVTADVIIKNVQKTDKGYYGCRAHNDQGTEYQETLLMIES